MTSSLRNLVFISYSHEDEEDGWHKDLLKHLKPYVRDSSIKAWSDKQIQPGSQWFNEIATALAKAKVAVLLVTPNFLASDFIHQHELTPLLRDAAAGGVKILWIPVRASSYPESPIRDYQAVIDPEKPLAEMTAQRDAAWVRICREIKRAVENELGPGRDTAEQPIAGRVQPVLNLLHPESQPAPHRPLIRDIERALADGDLQNSLIAPLVLEALGRETSLELAADYDASWIIGGIRLSDEYFAPVRLSAGRRDWQNDYAQTATPVLVGLARSLKRSSDAQACVLQFSKSLAARLRLSLVWPADPNESNDLSNAIYNACCEGEDVQCDDALIELRKLTVIGPQ